LVTGLLNLNSNYTYYGTVFGLNALGGSLLFNSIFSAAADVVGAFSAGPFTTNLNRRTHFAICQVIIIFCGFGFWFFTVPDECLKGDNYCY